MELKEFYSMKLYKKTVIAENVFELIFERPENFSFRAGQFVQFKIPSAEGEVLRSYSIASAPAKSEITFCVKLVKNGVASHFFTLLKEGERVMFSQPQGRFVVEENGSMQTVFIATGSGLAPIKAILEDELEKPRSQELFLLFGVRSEGDLFWQQQFKNWATTYPFFHYMPTLSQPEDDWSGLKGRVTAHLEPVLFNDAAYYVCGSLVMVKEVRALLLSKGIVAKNIHFEIF